MFPALNLYQMCKLDQAIVLCLQSLRKAQLKLITIIPVSCHRCLPVLSTHSSLRLVHDHQTTCNSLLAIDKINRAMIPRLLVILANSSLWQTQLLQINLLVLHHRSFRKSFHLLSKRSQIHYHSILLSTNHLLKQVLHCHFPYSYLTDQFLQVLNQWNCHMCNYQTLSRRNTQSRRTEWSRPMQLTQIKVSLETTTKLEYQ